MKNFVYTKQRSHAIEKSSFLEIARALSLSEQARLASGRNPMPSGPNIMMPLEHLENGDTHSQADPQRR
jgi:hypothetical protein